MKVQEQYLVAEGLYTECGPFLEGNKRLERLLELYQGPMEYEQQRAEQGEPVAPYAARKLLERATRLVALLVLNGRSTDAQLVVDKLLDVLESEESQASLSLALQGVFPEHSNQ